MKSAALARPRWSQSAWVGLIALVALCTWSYHGAEVDLGALFGGDALGQMSMYASSMFPPDMSPAALRDVVAGAAETFAISFVGSVLSVCLALPLALGATKTVLYRGILYEGQQLGVISQGWRRALYIGSKAALAVLRTIPELVWALIFVFVVGLGPFPGVLALGIHTAGVLGKLFGEVLEDVDQRPIEALQSTGASRLRIILYGILPQALPQFVGYSLYRWEVNIRAAAVLGFVGAGGLGQRIYVAISLFREQQLLTLIIAIYVMVTVVDALSTWLRARLV
jgi:phosphonate transport system permease protein